MTGNSTWHAKHVWHSIDFFADPQLLTLCEAIEANDADTVRRLLDRGVDANSVGKSGITPLLWAFPGATDECFTLLLDAGADSDVRISKRVGKGKPNTSGTSVTVLAARDGSAARFKQVLEYSADPNAKQDYMERTLVHVIIADSIVLEREQKLGILLDYGPDLNVFSAMEETPAMAAVSRGNLGMALTLLDAGADPNVYQPRTPQKLVHFVAREVEIRNEKWKHDHHDALQGLIARLETNGDLLDEAVEDIRRWSEIGRTHSLSAARQLIDAEIAKARAREAE